MDIKTSVNWVNSVCDSYGDSVQLVMEQHALNNLHHSSAIATNTLTFGIVTDDPEYLTAFANAGGNVEYLHKISQAFINIRSKHFGL